MKRNCNRLLALIVIIMVISSSLTVNAAALYRGDAASPFICAAAAGTDTGESAPAADAEGLAGFWKIAEIKGEKSSVTRDQVEAMEKMGRVLYLEFSEDGTALALGSSGTWDKDAVTIDGEPFSYTIEGNVLTLINARGEEMICEQTTEEELDAIQGFKEGVLDESVTYSDQEEKILDTDNASVSITGYKADKSGFTVRIHCANKTDSKVYVSVDKGVLNRYDINILAAYLLEAKEEKDLDCSFKIDQLEKCGISSIDEMILTLKVMNGESYETLEEETVTVYPTGKKAEDIKAPKWTSVDGELIVLDDENCALVIQGFDPDNISGFGVNFFYANRTDTIQTMMWSGEKLNDQDASGLCAVKVLPGTCVYGSGIFTDSSLEKAGIKEEDIKKMSAFVNVYSGDSASAKKIVDKEFTFVP